MGNRDAAMQHAPQFSHVSEDMEGESISEIVYKLIALTKAKTLLVIK